MNTILDKDIVKRILKCVPEGQVQPKNIIYNKIKYTRNQNGQYVMEKENG